MDLDAAPFNSTPLSDPHISLASMHCSEDLVDAPALTARRQFNTLCPINRLPPEILSHVFEDVLEPVQLHGDIFTWISSTTSLRSTKDLREVSHVCHRWRQISLSHHALWSHIHDSPDHTSPTPVFLQRSVHVPLKVCSTTNALSPFMLHLGRTHGARIQELRITSFLDPRIYTDFPAPALRQLVIQSNPISDRPYLIELFQGEAPLLRSLAPQSSSWLPANLFTNLTRLYLSSFIQRPGLPRANWTLYNLSSFLAKCPALEDVFIHPRHPMGLRDATLPIIRLRHLKTIILAGVSLNLVLWFLYHVTIPTGDVTVRILWLCRSGIETTLLPVLPHLPELVGLRKLHIQLAPAKDNSMKALVRVALSTANTSLELRIDNMIEHVEESQDPGWTSALLASLANRMALSNITEMQVIDGGWIQKFFDFPALFALLPALSVLVYSKGNKDQFVRLLKHLLPLSSGPDPAPCPCTHLATLHVCVGEIPTMIDDMVSFACDRRACGCPLRKCIVEVASGMTESCDASKLESYVDLVEIQSC